MRRALFLVVVLPLLGCNHIPAHWHQAPKVVEVDGQNHLACKGSILIYSPSRNTASSSSNTYEIVFTDDYGQSQDAENVTSYSVSDAPKDAHYAMSASASPDNLSTAYSNGIPFKPGNVVEWGSNGNAGRAIWEGPGKWVPVPCE
jgi:hypothetical protein